MKKILIKLVKIVTLALFTIVLLCLIFYSIHIVKQISFLNISSLNDVEESVFNIYETDSPADVYSLQDISIICALTGMEYNKYFFYIYPDFEAVLQSKMEYQEQLKILSNKLNYHDFENPDHGLKFLTAFYEHYLKIIEWNNTSVKNISINRQFYNNYNNVCLLLNKIIPFVILLFQLFYFFYCLFIIIRRFKK